MFPTGISITGSGIIGTVSLSTLPLLPTACIGGMFGQYTAGGLGIKNSYLYVDSSQIAKTDVPSVTECNGNIAGKLTASRVTGSQFYYWDVYKDLYGAESMGSQIGTSFKNIADNGALEIDDDPDNNVILFYDDDAPTTPSTVKIKRRTVDGDVCAVVQFKALFNSIIKNITMVCLAE